MGIRRQLCGALSFSLMNACCSKQQAQNDQSSVTSCAFRSFRPKHGGFRLASAAHFDTAVYVWGWGGKFLTQKMCPNNFFAASLDITHTYTHTHTTFKASLPGPRSGTENCGSVTTSS